MRHFDYDVVVVAACLQPTMNIGACNPFMLRQLTIRVKCAVTDVLKLPWNEEEWRAYISFAQQSAWGMRTRKNRTAEDFWSNVSNEFPTLNALFDVVRTVAASSADVERCFESHSRIASGRHRLGIQAVESQLIIHSHIAHEGKPVIPKQSVLVSPEDIQRYLDVVARLWKKLMAAELESGMVICTYWLNAESKARHRYIAERAELIKAEPDGCWRVKWKDTKSSTERF